MKGISILMYHQVGPFAPMKTHRALYCHHRRFSIQMLFLKTLGYRVLSLDTAVRCLKGEKEIPDRAVVLTFDDGYDNFYEYALPVLERHGFTAMIYILSGYIGRNAEWFAREGRPTPPLLSRDRIQRLMGRGISFGSHGMGHKRLTKLPDKRLRLEVLESKKNLEQLFGCRFRHFCFPYGDFDERVVSAVKEAGYESAVTCVRGMAYPGNDLFQLPRKAISYGDSLLGFIWKLHMKNRRKTPELRLP